MDKVTKFIIDKTIIDLEKAWNYVQNSLVYDAPVVQSRVDRAKRSISVLKHHLSTEQSDTADAQEINCCPMCGSKYCNENCGRENVL